MNIIYAILAVLIVAPTVGTLLFALVEKLSSPLKIKVLIMTLGHPFLAGLILWFGCSTFNHEIAKTSVLLVAGGLIGSIFSTKKYFVNLLREADLLTIDYVTSILQKKTVKISIGDIQKITQSKSKKIIEKPVTLTLTIAGDELKFYVLDKNYRNLVIM